MNRLAYPLRKWSQLAAGRVFRLCLAVVLLTSICAVQSSAPVVFAQAPLTLAGYRQVLSDSLSLLEQAVVEKNAETRAPLLSAAAEKLAGVHQVQLDARILLPVDNERLVAQIRAQSVSATANADALRALPVRLRALRDAIDTPPTQASGDELARLHDLLANPPFNLGQPPSDLERLITEWLQRLFGATARGIFNARDLIVLLGVLLVVIVLGFFIVNLRRNAVSEVALQTAAVGEAHLTSAAAIDHAERFASAGDYRAAVRQLYLATLLWLDEHGQLRYDRSLTNREYLRAIGDTPAVRDALQPIVDIFDRIWYGLTPISSGEFAAYRRAVEAIRKL